eukprot:3721085-Prymnesium_polylepis.1
MLACGGSRGRPLTGPGFAFVACVLWACDCVRCAGVDYCSRAVRRRCVDRDRCALLVVRSVWKRPQVSKSDHRNRLLVEFHMTFDFVTGLLAEDPGG